MTFGLKKIKIFIASSSELENDRDAFRLYISRLNDKFIEKGIYLEIIQWEYFLDAISKTRLQDEYNMALRNADIALCLFFTKVGKFSEEEFNTAYTTFKSTGKPRIWTYFKKAQIFVDTITAEINTLISFKKKLNDLGHFITAYESTADLHNKFRDQLDIFLPEFVLPGIANTAAAEQVALNLIQENDQVPKQPDQLNKEEIFNLIDLDLDQALEKLKILYANKNQKFNELGLKYLQRTNDSSIPYFRNELKKFVSKQPNTLPSQSVNREFNESLYKALCELDFKTQTAHFCEIYKHKKIAPFILYGQNEQEGKELQWFYKQLMSKEQFGNDTPIVIDMGSKLGSSFERLLVEFYTRFNIYNLTCEDDELFAVLKDEIQNRLATDHLLCVIKNAASIFADQVELNKVFNDFLGFMMKNIVRRGHKHSLIFLFIQDSLPAEIFRDKGYFLWFDKSKDIDYPLSAYQCEELKIFDLAPIGTLDEKDIRIWFKWALRNSPIFEEISVLMGKEKEILGVEGRPLQVIQNICSTLNITMDEQWIN